MKQIFRSFKTIGFWVFSVFVFGTYGLAQNPIATWKLVYPGPAPMTGMAYGNGTFVGVGSGMRFISHDGSNWAAYANPPILNPAGIAYGGGIFMTFGSNAQNGPTIYESTNGLNWSPAYTSSHLLSAAAYGNNTWVFIGQNGNTDIVTATMGSTNWNWSEYQPSYGTCCITYANGLFVLLMDSAPIEYIYTSPDGIVWQFVGTFPGTPGLNGQISYGNGVFVATDQVYNNIYTSSNLIQWATNTPYSAMIAFGGNWFLSSAFNSSTMSSSSNGYSWSTTSASYFSMIAYGQGTFIGCSNRNVYQSGVVAATSNPPPANLSIATYAGITVNGTPGLAYQIQYNTKLNTNWMTLTNFSLPYSPYLWIDTSTTVTGQRFYRSVQIQ